MALFPPGDYGPFFGIMVFIVAILVASLLFSKCCVGDEGFMRTGYDFEGYVMRKFAVCVGTGRPKRTHPDVEVGPLEIGIGVEFVEEGMASQPLPPPPFPAPAPPAAAPTAHPPVATSAPPPVVVAVAAPALATKKEEEDEEEDEDDDDEEFLFDEE